MEAHTPRVLQSLQKACSLRFFVESSGCCISIITVQTWSLNATAAGCRLAVFFWGGDGWGGGGSGNKRCCFTF